MPYSPKRYAKFSTNQLVFFQGKEDLIECTFLDLTNDVWTYRLKNLNRWVPETELSSELATPISISNTTTVSL
jgi:hypothetical protein